MEDPQQFQPERQCLENTSIALEIFKRCEVLFIDLRADVKRLLKVKPGL